MKKRLISIGLALIMALSLLTIAAIASNADEPSSWAVPEVDKAKGLGLVPSTLQSKYTDATTRAEFCLLAVTLYEKVTGITITGRVKFTDTTDVNVEKAAYIGVVNGVGNNMFDPNGTLTREQAATMLARLAESVSKPLDKKAATFGDKGSVSTWALEAVGQCQAADIMGGTGDNQFSPKGPYQRQQSIATITRMYDYLDGKGTPNPAMEVLTTTEPTEEPTTTPEQTTPETTPTPSTPSGGIDQALIGEWNYQSMLFNPYGGANMIFYGYTFESNGRVLYTSMNYTVEGKYTTSGGKIYVTEAVYKHTNGEEISLGNVTIEYYIESGETETLRTGRMVSDSNYIENAETPFKRIK